MAAPMVSCNMTASSVLKIQLFGHSYVTRFLDFIRSDATLRTNFNLDGNPLVQYSGFPGARVRTLEQNLEVVEDFHPDILVLIIGTNDLCDTNTTPSAVVHKICDLIRTLLDVIHIPRVIVLPCLHRAWPEVRSRFRIDPVLFNQRADSLNLLLSTHLRTFPQNRVHLWRLKGFWSPKAERNYLHVDGVHLSRHGQRRLFHNIRAALVAARRNTLA